MNRKTKSACLAVAPLALLTFQCPPSGAQSRPPVKSTPAPAQQDSPFADIPKGSWVYPAFSTLIEHRILSATGNGEGGRFPSWKIGDPFARYQAAVSLARGIDVAFKEETEKKKNSKYRKKLKAFDDVVLCERLTTEFSVELKTLGMDVPFILRKLDGMEQKARALESPFPDVAPMHWASMSIERLRVAGVLIGYPDSTFLDQQKRKVNP